MAFGCWQNRRKSQFPSRICAGKRKINLSTVFASQMVGIREIEDRLLFTGSASREARRNQYRKAARRPEPACLHVRINVLPMTSLEILRNIGEEAARQPVILRVESHLADNLHFVACALRGQPRR